VVCPISSPERERYIRCHQTKSDISKYRDLAMSSRTNARFWQDIGEAVVYGGVDLLRDKYITGNIG